jgi:hypothetical protein
VGQMKKIFIAVTMAVLMGASAPQALAGTTGPVEGAGSGALPASFGPLAGDRIHVVLSARGSEGPSQGHFQIVHEGKGGGVKADVTGTIDCVSLSGTTAYVTGTITEGRVTEAPGFDPAGQTAAITVVDDGTSDQAGVDLSFFGTPHAIAPCQAVSPYMSIDRGNFNVSA